MPRSSVIKKDSDRPGAGSSGRYASAGPMAGLSAPDRPGAAGLHRRDLDQDQHGALARLGAARPTPAGQGSARPLEDPDLHRRLAPRTGGGTMADRRADQW